MTAVAPPRTTTTTDYAADLDAAHRAAAPDAVVVGPGGYAFATPERLAGDPLWLSGTTGHALRPAAVLPVGNRVAAGFGVACARLVDPVPADPVPADPVPGDPAGARLRHHLLRAHTRLLGRVVELVVADLGGRTAAGSPLLGRQLVQAGIADATLLVEETGGLLDAGADHDTHPAAFARLVRGGRALLRLFGAAGFLGDGPGGAVLTAEQVGTLYLAVPRG